jgi:hypothetical protein
LAKKHFFKSRDPAFTLRYRMRTKKEGWAYSIQHTAYSTQHIAHSIQYKTVQSDGRNPTDKSGVGVRAIIKKQTMAKAADYSVNIMATPGVIEWFHKWMRGWLNESPFGCLWGRC